MKRNAIRLGFFKKVLGVWHFLFLRKGVTGHMEKLVKVAVDAMGGDHAPGEVVKGAVDAVNEKTV